MAHKQQINFCKSVSKQYSGFFNNCNVLEVGSLNINGTVRNLFTDCNYIGLDLGKGKGVDVVSPVHLYKHDPFDTIICTEMLEHDQYFEKSLQAMYDLLKPFGLIIITAASTGRKEHGTAKRNQQDSPFTSYYKNVTKEMLEPFTKKFKLQHLEILNTDIRFWGIK